MIDLNAPCDEPEKRREYLLNLVPEKHREKMMVREKNVKSVFPGYKRMRHGRQVLELRFDGVAGCLRTPEGGSSRQFLVITENGTVKTRLLTVREAAALMGARKSATRYPEPITTDTGPWGDAVAVPVSRFLAETLLSPLAELIKERGF